MSFKSLAIAILLLSPVIALAQSASQQTQAAVTTYEELIRVATRLNNPKLLATSYYNLGRTYSGLNQFSNAIGAYEKSREYFESLGLERDEIYVLADLGALYFIQEDYEKAREYSERSLSIAESAKTNVPPGAWPDGFGRARALETLAELDTRSGDHEKAIEKLQQSLALFQQLNNNSSTYDYYLAGVYAGLGRAYPEIGDSTRALLYLNKALEIANGQSDSDSIASLRNDIGYLYMEQEDYPQAHAQFSESLKIYATEKNHKERARLLLNLGVVEQRRANYDEALRYFRLSLQAATEANSFRVQIADLEGIGVVLTAKKDFVGALEAFNGGFALAKDTKNNIRQAEILWRSAQAYYAAENYPKSSEMAVSAVAFSHASHSAKLTLLATTTLGESYAAQTKYDLAIQTLKEAISQLEALREQVAGSEVETQLFLEDKVSAYQSLVEIFIRQGNPLDALLFAERAKGRVLLDLLSRGAGPSKLLTPDEKKEERRLNQRISDLNNRIKIAEGVTSPPSNSLIQQLDAARLEYQSFRDAVFVAHPELSIRAGRAATLDRGEVKSLARTNESAYLEYVITKAHVYLFVLTAHRSTNSPELRTYQLTITPEELIQKVDKFHDQLANIHPDYSELAHELYGSLIAPAAEQLKGVDTLCIVPDGFLWNLPFQALMPAAEHYLLQDHAIYYVPSLSVLRTINKEHQGGRTESLIAFGNPVIGKDEQRQVDLCPLPEAENEVSSIAKTAGLGEEKVFVGRDASEKAFKTLAPGFSVIHLATHGVLDNRNPLYSHLLLTKTEGDSDNDGLLEAREIMDMKLNADLAVLSACETANGKIAPGEGVIGLSWAFFVAGTRSVVVSQWKVNSSSTSQLMVNFYRQLDYPRHRAGTPNAIALRAAALQLMKDDRYAHPFFWSGFVLVGMN